MQKQNTPFKPSRQGINSYIKYTGMGFQMLAIIGAFTWLGVYLDDKWALETPWMTAGLALVGVSISIYLIIRQLIK